MKIKNLFFRLHVAVCMSAAALLAPLGAQAQDPSIILNVNVDWGDHGELRYAGQFYDYDGDGQMEFITIYTDYIRDAEGNVVRDENNEDYHGAFLKIFSYDGTLKYTSVELSRATSSSDYYRTLVSVEDMNGDGKPEIVCKNNISDYTYVVYIYSTDGTLLTTFTITWVSYYKDKYGDEVMIFDANNDGRSDFFIFEEGSYNIYYQQPDGSFVKTAIKILEDPSEIENAMFAQYGANATVTRPLNFSGACLAKSGGQPLLKMATDAQLFTNAKPMAADINMDGFPDLLNLRNGNALLSIGDGTYYYGTFEGQVTAKDLNGDGMMDFILYDEDSKTVTLYIYEGNNSFASKTLMQNFNISGVYTYDIDHDGDIDIVLPFDYTESSEYAYLVFFENQGDNNFKKRERAFEHAREISFIGGGDVDNDGNFEMIAQSTFTDENGNNPYWEMFLVDCLPTFEIGEESKSVSKWHGDEIIFADTNNDGKIEYYDKPEYYWDETGFHKRTAISQFTTSNPNTAPQKMGTPKYIFDGAANMLRVEWEPAADAENSACDLTYTLRIGTQPGADDVWAAHADANGRRLRPGKGNVGYGTYTLASTAGWKRGTYYMAVQAIDANGLGGPWSDEVQFEYTGLTANFLVSTHQLATADTLVATTAMPYDDAMTYTWNLGTDGEILKRDGNKWYIVFNKTGNKTINLSVAAADGATAASETVDLAVYPAKWTRIYDVNNYHTYTNSFVDLDLDGLPEYLSRYGGIYKLVDGAWQKVSGTFNSDLEFGSIFITDLNMDGIADIFSESNKGNWFVNDGECYFEDIQDMEYTVSSNLSYGVTDKRYRFDINNDGFLDVINRRNIGMNQGDNLTFEESAITDDSYSFRQYIDFDRDGYIDLIYVCYTNNTYYLFRNNGDGTFEQIQLASADKSVFFCDMNNDGYPDMIWSIDPSLNGDVLETGSTHIVLGDETMNYDGKEEIVIDGFAALFDAGISSKEFVDMDNNGMIDLRVTVADGFRTNARGELYLETATGTLYLFPGWETVFEKDAAYVESTDLFTDIDGDGLPDYMEYGAGIMQSRLTNSAPAAPGNVRAVQTDNGILLQWDDAIDAETPKAHMLYNVSLKIKDAKGDNSYIISPLNADSDVASTVPDHTAYKKATRMMVPLSRFVAGTEYELRVQAIDGWNAHSPFSQVFTFKVESQVVISAPTEACAGTPVTFTYTGTEQGTPEWATADGTVVATDGNTAEIVWATGGLKTVSLAIGGTTTERAIRIEEAADLAADMPQQVLSGTAIGFRLPSIFADATAGAAIYSPPYKDGTAPLPIGTCTNAEAAMQSTEAVAIERIGNSLDARAMFNTEGTATLTFSLDNDVCGTQTSSYDIEVVYVKPEISIVTTNGTTGRNVVNWDADAVASMPVDFTNVIVYKESGSTNNFVPIGRAAVADGQFEDTTSDPTVRKYRYRIALATADGAVSAQSDTHGSVHVMLNQGISANHINIVWTKYEGGIVDSYEILRGTSADALEVLATAGGYETSYTDQEKPDGDVYYAVRYSNLYTEANKAATLKAANFDGCSNVVYSGNAATVRFAESMNVMVVESYQGLLPTQQQLHFYAEIMPGTATYKRVNWQVTAGADLATISDDGVLTYIGGGKEGDITVTATAVDGSGISATKTIKADRFNVLAVSITIEAYNGMLTPDAPSEQIVASVLPDDTTNPELVWEITSGAEYATVSETGLVTATGAGDGRVDIKVSTTDGSGVDTYFAVFTSGFLVLAESITIEAYTDVLTPDAPSVQIVASVLPDDTTNPELVWEITSGAEYATVSETGLITATGAGNGITVIKVSTTDGSGVSEYVTVNTLGFSGEVLAESIELSAATTTLTPENPSVELTVTLLPDNVSTTEVTWTVVGTQYVTLADGVATATGTADGKAMITATTTDGTNLAASITITVSGFGTAIEEVERAGVDIFAVGRNIVVENAEGMGIAIYNTAGQVVASVGKASASESFAMPVAGVYIVKTDAAVEKILLK